MSGLIALLDNVAAFTKVAAKSLDDVVSMAAKAGTKAAGVVIDDAAVTPKYVTGLDPKRELPIIWKIARASVFNKLVILLPVAMLLKAFAPVLLIPLLMIGGLYLSFEGAEKIYHVLRPDANTHVEAEINIGDPVKLEETYVKGAVKTDFILSAEIMTITLNEIPDGSIGLQAAALALVAIAITVLVYGVVGLIVKMDDVGAWLALHANTRLGRGIGTGLVRGMPHFLKVLSTVGTAAMLWVGGQILVHGLHNPDFIGLAQPYEFIKEIAHTIAGDVGFGNWAITAFFDGVIGLAIGLLLIPLMTGVMGLLIGFADKTNAKP
jgi:predicted DNA repair protein MutK